MHSKNQRGFTLIELIVSLTAGLLISAAAFLMARNSSNFFQHEAGITSAQYAVTIGMARLQADFKNAAFLGPANLDRDDDVANGNLCAPALGFAAPFAGLADLAGVRIIANGSYSGTNSTAALQALWDANGNMRPDAILIAGSFDTTEQFSAAAISPAGAGPYTVVLNETNDGATIRARLAAQRGGAPFTQIFRPGRVLRVRDNEGRYSLGVIDTVTDNTPGPGQVSITLLAAPAMGKREVNGSCGCAGFCVGAPVNVIARMRYEVGSIVANANYATLLLGSGYAAAATYHRGPTLGVDFQGARSELIRTEVMANGNDDVNSVQVLAEHAVDLEFGVTYEAAAATNPPTVIREPVGAIVNGYTTAGLPSAGGRPDLVRSVQVRLSARAPRRDRDIGLAPLNGSLLRFDLGANQGFARMRTLVTDIALPNQTERLLP